MTEHGLAFPEPGESFSLGGWRGNVGAAKRVQPQSELARSQGRYLPATGPIGSAQLDDRRDLVFTVRPELSDAARYLELRRREVPGHRNWFDQGLQPIVEMIDPGEKMQHALIDPQRSGHESFVVGQFDQAPAAQGCGRGERAPVRARQGGEGQTECWINLARVGLRCRARSRKVGIQLDAGAEQEQIAFEW